MNIVLECAYFSAPCIACVINAVKFEKHHAMIKCNVLEWKLLSYMHIIWYIQYKTGLTLICFGEGAK